MFDTNAGLIVLGILIVTSSSLVGLVAVWAALGRGHWFFRIAVLGGLLLLALPIPANDPMLVFFAQSVVVVGTIVLTRTLRLRTTSRGTEVALAVDRTGAVTAKFSLRDLLLMMAVAAVFFAVVANVPMEQWAWESSLSYIGLGAWLGAITLLSTWVALGRPRRSLCLLLLLAIPIMLASHWIFVKSHFDVWFMKNSLLGMITTSFTVVGKSDYIWWLVVMAPLGWITPAWLALARMPPALVPGFTHVESRHETLHRINKRRTAVRGIVLVLVSLVILIPPVWVYYRLVTPTPIPTIALPEPNGYDDLVEAGKMLDNLVLADPYTATKSALRQAVSNGREGFERARRGLAREFRIPITYDIDDWGVEFQSLRQVARAFYAEAQLAEIEGRIDDAINSYLDDVRLGLVVSPDGLLLSYAVGSALEGIGFDGLLGLRSTLNKDLCRRVISELEKLEASRVPVENSFEQERIWKQHAYGWYGRLDLAVSDLTGESYSSYTNDNYRYIEKRRQTQTRLLIAELSVHSYRLEHDKIPETLAELVPDYFSAVPNDPFGEGPLVYRVTDDSYLLYSIGPDGKDDGGIPMAEVMSDTGDFFVDTGYEEDASIGEAVDDADDDTDAPDADEE